MGTFGLGHDIRFPGIPRHHPTWEKVQKVPPGFGVSFQLSHWSARVVSSFMAAGLNVDLNRVVPVGLGWLSCLSPGSGSRGPLSVWASKRPDQIVLPFSFGTLLPRPQAGVTRTKRRKDDDATLRVTLSLRHIHV